MTVFTIRILNTNKLYGKDNYIYAFKYKYQAYKTIKRWFIKKRNIPDNIIEIRQNSLNEMPSYMDIVIPHSHVNISHGDFISTTEIKEQLEQIYEL